MTDAALPTALTDPPGNIWVIIIALGLTTFTLRFSFLGLIGGRQLPEWVLRHLRYVAVAVMPALIAPIIVWPDATTAEIDPIRIMAALIAVACGVVTRSVIWTVIIGMGALAVLQNALPHALPL